MHVSNKHSFVRVYLKSKLAQVYRVCVVKNKQNANNMCCSPNTQSNKLYQSEKMYTYLNENAQQNPTIKSQVGVFV